ncbi:MAG: VRR-NUC domain-containing protein [Gammaproteobacteria bacterium]|nr:MAG: VRR-NUC domain-containing protein [Gammaproteobacteria bacterium]
MIRSPELPPLYYLDNMTHVVRHVLSLYADLMDEAFRQRCEAFLTLPRPAAALLTRLMGRKGPLFRADRLRYPEIPDLPAARTSLSDGGWIRPPGEADLPGLIHLLTVKELDRFFPDVRPLKGRAAKVAALPDMDPASWAEQTGLQAIALNTGDWPERLRLLYFGNLNQDMTTFVTAQLGVQRYPVYTVRKDTRFFNSKAEIDMALTLHTLREAIPGAASPPELMALARQLPPRPEHPVLKRRHDKALNALGYRAEQLGKPEWAADWYVKSERPPARERRVRLAVRQGQTDTALALLATIRDAPASEPELAFLERFEPRLRKSLNQSVPKRWQPPTQTANLPVHPRGVEAAVIDWLAEEANAAAYHVENRLFMMLFRLQFHEVLFANVRGAFTHPFQWWPHDLGTPEFHAQRRHLINKAWREMDGPDWHERLFSRLDSEACRYLHDWLPEGVGVLEQTLARVPRSHLRAILGRILADPVFNGSGLPDLIAFPEAGGYALLEVKGPGDRLQDNQWRWLRFFQAEDIPARQVRVRWTT